MEGSPAACIGWIKTLFNECVTTQQQTMSLLLGYVSILCWLNAQIPQIIENFKLGSAESLSLPFLINWLLGDISNLIGCILTHQLPFQMYLAIYFCIADIILFGQWIYYSRQNRYKRLAQHDMPDIMVGDLPEISETDHHRHSFHPAPSLSSRPRHSRRTTSGTVTAAPAASTTATAILPLHHDLVQSDGAELGSDLEQAENLSPLMHRPRTRRATTASDISHRRSTSIVLFGLMLLTLRQTWPTDSTLEAHFGSGSLVTGSSPYKGRVFARADLAQDETITNEPTDVNIVQLGRIFAWVCTVFYLSSRMPQLWKNYKRKSVQGLSILMFFWAAMGNLSYTLSILNSREAVDPATRQRFLREAVPYVLGSSGTLMFDLSIFCQWLYYTGKFQFLDRIMDRVFGAHRAHRRHGPRIGGGHRHHHARQRGSHPSRLDSMALSPSGSQSGLYNILADEEDPDLVEESILEAPKTTAGASSTSAASLSEPRLQMNRSSSLPALAADHTHSP